MSKFFGPGAIASSKVVRTQTTSSFAKPSSSATAEATAASKPSPDSGASSTTQGK